MTRQELPEGSPNTTPATTPSASQSSQRIKWPEVLTTAKQIVTGYDTGVTLRQLFYRLASIQAIPNTKASYKTLSSRTAEERRNGDFPDLVELGRPIQVRASWTSPQEGLLALADQYRLDRTEGQPCTIYLGVEKRGLSTQLSAWFGDLGLPVVGLGGYPSQTLCDTVSAAVETVDRPAVFIYSGDFDASGEDILRDVVARTGCFDKVVQVALTAEQVALYGIPENPGKATDSRSAAFMRRHGASVQVEVDALEPDVLRRLYQDAIDEFFDVDIYREVLDQEDDDKSTLAELASEMDR